ncbi:hypothetical protein [Halorubrum vacuolatum]|uniref:Uncharacterized protein n=1 Tax=Halorubrum vacuolatum TaxID=63740 RepID=A0A238WRX2_HALVU|nr:hypothetical protein [Halorubrum vacuolatum]SNR49267.1 hypothetical protein SAMN06264855_109130 [Halorubrum vacuolatum]
MSESTSSTFNGWADRLTWLLAEGQILVLGLAFTLGGIIVIYRPTLPSVPPIVVGWIAAILLFGPPLFAFFVVFVRRLRNRNMVAVHQVNGRSDVVEKYYVEPTIWQDKKIEGPAPYPINGGAAWGVQEFEYDEDLGDLRVKGVWLSECEDTKILTSKSHFEAIYEKLTESHIALNVMRDSVSEFGADIQQTLVNRGAEAREKGTLMDERAVKDVFEAFGEDISGTGADDLPTLELEELASEAVGEPERNGSAPSDGLGPEEVPADD